jgi:ankyrin repeat protein
VALHFACALGHLNVAFFLLKRGAGIERRDDVSQLIVSCCQMLQYGRTPLNLATVFGHVDVVSLLLDQAADLESRTVSFVATSG